jgi:hypothetical protein
MLYRIMVTVVVAGCLMMILGCGTGILTLQRGLVPPRPISVMVGRIEVAAFTEIISSSIYPTHAYYTVWVFVRSGSPAGSRAIQTLVWGRRIARLEVPDPRPR